MFTFHISQPNKEIININSCLPCVNFVIKHPRQVATSLVPSLSLSACLCKFTYSNFPIRLHIITLTSSYCLLKITEKYSIFFWQCVAKKIGIYIGRWYYNPAKEACFEFTYGGCGGNQNRFESQNMCQVRDF